MPDVGVPELLIIAVIVLLLFGPGKAADLGSSLGRGIREFRKASREDDDPPPTTPAPGALPERSRAVAEGIPEVPTATEVRFCTECGAQARDAQKFCTACGTSLLSTV